MLIPKRGDMFVADLGQGTGSEQENERPVVIVQNNKGNSYADTTIIVPITSRMKNDIPNHVIIHYGISRLKYLEENNDINDDQKSRISQALQIIDNNSCELTEYKDMLIRKLIECVKVNSKTEITIIFKGGYEVIAEVEK